MERADREPSFKKKFCQKSFENNRERDKTKNVSKNQPFLEKIKFAFFIFMRISKVGTCKF